MDDYLGNSGAIQSENNYYTEIFCLLIVLNNVQLNFVKKNAILRTKGNLFFEYKSRG